MSLINKMLQELDSRRSEVTGSGPFGQQVRAVPERRRIHPAWWGVVGLSGILAGVLAWMALRPPVNAPQPVGTQLPLKLDIDLNAAPAAPAAQQAGEAPSRAEAANVTPVGAGDANSITARPESSGAQSASTMPAGPVPAQPHNQVKKQARSIKQEKPAPDVSVPELSKVVPPAKSLASVPAPAAKSVEVNAPVAINKLVKELSPQQRAENEFRKAVSLIQQGKTGDAIAGLEEALRLDPKHTDARHALIGALLNGNRQEEAMRKASEGLEINPAQHVLAMILARLQLERGELRAAIESLERSLPYAVDRPDFQAFLAALLQRDERHKKAVEHYLLALQKSPQNGVWWMGLGISFQADGRLPEAQEAYKRAKATNSLSPELLAFVEGRLGQLQR